MLVSALRLVLCNHFTLVLAIFVNKEINRKVVSFFISACDNRRTLPYSKTINDKLSVKNVLKNSPLM